MIKVATITTHGALNYGAVLQAYALSTYLNGAGYHCEILDYRPNYVKESYRLIKAPHSPSGVHGDAEHYGQAFAATALSLHRGVDGGFPGTEL